MLFKKMTSPEHIIAVYPWFQDIDFSDTSPAICLSKCLAGEYEIDLAIKGEDAVGIVIYRMQGDYCWVVGSWCKNNLKGFPDMFFINLKDRGIKRVRCSSTRDPRAFAKVMGMDRLWSVFEKEL